MCDREDLSILTTGMIFTLIWFAGFLTHIVTVISLIWWIWLCMTGERGHVGMSITSGTDEY